MLISIKEATEILGLKSRNSIYRKIESKELPVVRSADGPLIERDGLEQLWSRITRKRTDSPEPRQRSTQKQEPPPRSADDGEIPDFNEERARHEREKRLIAEMERRQKAGELVYREDYDQAQKAAALYLSGQIEALPRQIRQQLPHLSAGDEEVIEQLVRRLLNQVADWRMDRDEVAA